MDTNKPINQYDMEIFLPEESFIAMIYYNSDRQELYVVFRKGKKPYRYTNISHLTWRELINSNNVIKYLRENIMKRKYNTKLDSNQSWLAQ